MIPHHARALDEKQTLITTHKKSMVINCPFWKYMLGKRKYSDGAMIQEAFYFLNEDEREFLLSGIDPEEWNSIFGEEQ